jgi:hypothetical protein
MKNFIQSFRDSSRQTLFLSLIFMLGVLLSAYALFMLPHELVFKGNVANVSLATWVFVKLGTVVMATFLIGIFAISIAIQTKKETIVYIEKKAEEEKVTEAQQDNRDEVLFDLEAFKDNVMEKGEAYLQGALNELCEATQAGQGAIYLTQNHEGRKVLELTYGFALAVAETNALCFEYGEGLIGQVAASGKSVYLDEIPEGYISIISGLGTSYPRYLLIIPLLDGKLVKGVIEVATFKPISEINRTELAKVAGFLASKLN